MTLLLTHSTETPLPELQRPLTEYAWFELQHRDARWVLYGRLGNSGYAGKELVASYLPETGRHLGQAVLHKLDVLHLSACMLLGVYPWMKR